MYDGVHILWQVKKLRHEKNRLERLVQRGEKANEEAERLSKQNNALESIIERLTQDKIRLGDVMTKQSNHNKRLTAKNDKLQSTIQGLERKVQHQEGQISRLQGRLDFESISIE